MPIEYHGGPGHDPHARVKLEEHQETLKEIKNEILERHLELCRFLEAHEKRLLVLEQLAFRKFWGRIKWLLLGR